MALALYLYYTNISIKQKVERVGNHGSWSYNTLCYTSKSRLKPKSGITIEKTSIHETHADIPFPYSVFESTKADAQTGISQFLAGVKSICRGYLIALQQLLDITIHVVSNFQPTKRVSCVQDTATATRLLRRLEKELS